MNLLDKYLIKKFIFNLFFGLSAIIIVFLVIDIVENIDKFLDKGATLAIVALYYLYFIPHIISLTLPIIMLLATLFSIGNMTKHNEVVAQKSSGVSLYRIFAPLFIGGFLLSILAGIFSETIVPWASQKKYDIYRYDINKNPKNIGMNRNNIYIQDSADRKVFVGFFNGAKNEAQRISLYYFDGPRLIKRIDAKNMSWKDQKWVLNNVVERQFKNSNEDIINYPKLAVSDFRFKPENLLELQKKPEEMSYIELDKFIDEKRAIGMEDKKWIVELYMKISYPFASFIIVLFGAPLAARKRRGGNAVGIGVSLLVCFIYYFFVHTGRVMGHQGSIPPLFAAWFGNIIFSIAGIFTMVKARM